MHSPIHTILAVLLLAVGVAAAQTAAAQTGTVAGRVTDAATGEALPGATVAVVGTALGAATGDDGRFAVPRVPAGAQTVRVSFVGYVPAERAVTVRPGQTAALDVALAPDAGALGEVTVNSDAEAQAVRESPFAVTVVDGQRLAGRGLTLDEAIARAAGVQVRRSGGLGSTSVFNIRGLEGQRVQIYIDGNAADVVGNALTLDDIPLQLVERIEVYKGVVPARFGGDGLGAAINVVTRHPEGGYLDAGYTAGSFGQHQVSVTGQRPLGRGFEAAATLNVDRAANDYSFESPFEPGLVVKRDHDRFRRTLAAASLSTDRLGFDEVELEGSFIGTDREIQGVQTNVQHARARSQFGGLVLRAESEGAWGGRLDARVALAAVRVRGGITDTSAFRYRFDGTRFPTPGGRGELGFVPSDSDNRTRFYRQRTALTYRFSAAHTASFTAVIDRTLYRPSDSLANRYAGRNVSTFPGDQTAAVVGLSHEWRPLGRRLVNVVGVRGYAMRSRGTPSNLLNPSTTAPPEARTSLLDVGASEAVRYRLAPWVLVKASVELARRLPASAELFGDGLLVFAAPTLRPEQSLNLSAGLQVERALPAGRLQAEVTGFWMRLDDMIRLGGGVAGASYTNLGAARIAGVDAEVRADVAPWLYAQAGLTLQNARDALRFEPGTTAPSPTYGLRLPNLPWLFGQATLEAHADGLLGRGTRSRLFAEGAYTEAYFYAFEVSRRQERRIPRALTAGLGVEHAWLRAGFTLSAEVQNATDARVLNQFNLPLPGRAFRLKLRYTLVGSGR